jgi:hypothetical protein
LPVKKKGGGLARGVIGSIESVAAWRAVEGKRIMREARARRKYEDQGCQLPRAGRAVERKRSSGRGRTD